MGKKVLLVAVTALVVGASGLHFLKPAAAEPESKGKVHVFTFKQTESKELDLGDDGPSPGDQFIFSGKVLKHNSDEKVGDFDGACVLTRAGDDPQSGRAMCTVAVTSDKGQVVSTGLVDLEDAQPGKSFKVPLIGGTEHFVGARGQFIVEPKDEDELKVTIDPIHHS